MRIQLILNYDTIRTSGMPLMRCKQEEATFSIIETLETHPLAEKKRIRMKKQFISHTRNNIARRI